MGHAKQLGFENPGIELCPAGGLLPSLVPWLMLKRKMGMNAAKI